jgi:myo-inositol-hexaphosphate 3-phosphohydrolase/phosphodiesterase/alkaline phosphatase D-like protein
MVSTNTIRFSQFNASLNRNNEGQLVTDLSTLDNLQAKAVAEIIQRNNPDVLLINEFDYVAGNPLEAVQLLQQNYLGVSQNGATPVNYPYVYIAPSNTGIASGFDLNNDGVVVTTPGAAGYGDDAFGFGNFSGQYGLLLLSKYPIDTANVRTFQNFLWKDMPDSLLSTVATPGAVTPWYSPEEQAVLRLSSKSHWDVPIKVNGETIHVLVSHPTPPTFDGAEDRNGKRNHDEIRFWADYITPGKGSYIYDDQGKTGGITAGSSFVIMGDQNADPLDGDSFDNAIRQLLQNPGINTNVIPTSLGGPQQAILQGGANVTQKGNPAFDTADFADTAPGNLRTDYVLPSANLQISQSAVYWPVNTDPNFAAVGTYNPSFLGGFPSSDHRLVYADVFLGATEAGKTLPVANPSDFPSTPNIRLQGQTILPTGFIPSGAAGTVNGTATALGGLSGITYDAAKKQFYAISDDRSQVGPARFYTLITDAAGVTFTSVTPIKDANGNFFALNSLDPEGIAVTNKGTVFISSEGEVNPGAGRVTNPFIKEFSLTTGQEVRTLSVPKKFLPVVVDTNGNGVVDAGDTQTSGVRNNLAFESLTITPDQKTLFTATENALFQDGTAATTSSSSRSRILQYNLLSGQPEKEYLYITDAAITPNPVTGATDNGLVDLLAIDNRGTLLALERSFAAGVGNTIKIYEVTLQGATDISVYDSLSSLSATQLAAIAPAQKRLLVNLNSLNLPNSDGNHPTGTDNIEGITFGPKLADGRQTIVLVSDNNFGATQFTQILTLSADVVPTATPTVETRPDLFDDPALPTSQRADADDPAIYINGTNSSLSLVLTSVKNAGLRVYDLSGNLLQEVNPGGIRYNNIDLQYGFKLGGQSVDIAVASDRQNDKLAIFKINPNGNGNGKYLENITDSSAATLFEAAPFDPPYSPSTRSAYGLALYRSPITNDYYVFANRRATGDVGQFKLIDKGNGKIGYELVREFTIPSPTTPGRSPQTEGTVIDQELGYLYIAQEDVGIWKFSAEPNGSNTGKLIDKVRFEGGNNLTDDAEGLTIYYGKNGTGYLLASSQGDNTFAAYTREGNNDFVGRFAVGNNGSIDSVQESDGADVVNVPLGPNFPFGLFVTQDGNNEPAKTINGENVNSNFKFVPWENIANAFPTALAIDTTSYDPRNPVAQPKLTTYEFQNLPKLGTTTTGQDIFLGGFSGLYFQGIAPNGNLKFVTNTDRGPNGEPTGVNRPFFLPDFQPEIVSFELNKSTGEITITKRTGLYRQDGITPLTGLPNLQAGAGGLAYTDEVAVDLNNKPLPNDPLGADVEGIVVAKNGDYWLVDEYRPAIYHFDVNGKLLDRFIPKGTATAPNPDQPAGTFGTEVLPEVYASRRNNRGFEAVALEGSKLYAFIQSPIDNPDNTGDTTSRGSRNLRILEFDIATKQVTGEYLYLLDDITGAGNAKTDKLGDAVSLGNGKFAVVERDDLGTNASNKLIYQIDLTRATNINNPANFTLPTGKTIEQLSPTELAAAKIIPVTKNLIANAAQLGYTGVEKLEGLALVAPNTLALLNDNDFNVTGNTPTEKLGILELPKPLDVVPTVLPTVETSPGLFNDPTLPTSQRADADDPAIYINADNSAKSIVLATAKNSGLRVYDLSGQLLQEINPGGIRYNNVDLQYGFKLGGQSVDIAVASDRQNDKLVIFQINPDGNGNGKYLQDITDSNAATLFEGLPFTSPYSPSTRSAYGLALYRSPITNDYYVFANRRTTGDVAQFKLIDKGNGKIGYELVREFTIPSPTDPTRSPQTEGTVVDQELGYLYIAQEDVGIWKFSAEPDGGKTGKLIDQVRFEGGTHLTDDAEGLTIYYGKDGTGYLLASSQGDSTFVAYTREGNNDYLGNFSIGKNGSIDSVQESDGADVINVSLGPDFPLGLFVTQDGYNDPTKIVDGANVNTNFKFVPWENIANVFPTALAIDTTSYDPRHPVNRTNVSSINGIASGDTTQDSTVLWARSIFPGAVKFEYSTDANFSVIAGTKNTVVTNINQPIKVEIGGLQAGTDYYYRVTDAAGATSIGKFSTAAAPGTQAGLTFGVSGDWRGELAPYPAISNADERNLKFFVEFGDTIYADFPSPGLKNPDGTEKAQAITLEDYRAKHAEVYSQRYGQNTWGDLRASTSILATIDDHEVVNDFEGGEDLAKASAADKALYGATSGLVNDSPLYENGLQAFQEYNPIRDEFYGQTGDARTDGERKLYRYNTYGGDAATFVLDARSFRDAELPGVANTNDPAQVGDFLAKSFNPTRTLLGRSQVEDLKRDLLKSEQDGQTWKFIMIPEPIQNLGVVGASDRFEGYAAERTEILKFINDNKINNVVFVSADIHGTLVNNLTYQLAPGQAQIATSAFEITTGSVAFDAPFGQTVAQLASAVGLLTPAQQQFYNSLPIANDKDSIVNDKDDFIKQIVNSGLNPLGYDPIGLNDNLAQANGLINANLLQGDYIASHTFGWTEFNIDQQTQKLTVTTYGVDAYTREELAANPNVIANRQPAIVSQFEVNPTFKTTPIPEISTTLDLRNVKQPLTAEFVVNREAAFDNFVGFYQVVDKNGGIDINADGKADLLPGQAGYTQAAVRGRIPGIDLAVNSQGSATYTGIFKPGAIFAPFLIVDGRPDAILDTNPNNDPSVYFPFLGANTDKSEHVRLLGNNILGFEDLPFGGDKDFNDVTVKISLSFA